MVKMVEFESKAEWSKKRFQPIPSDRAEYCQIKLAYGKEDGPPRRKAPPPSWTDIPVKAAPGTARVENWRSSQRKAKIRQKARRKR